MEYRIAQWWRIVGGVFSALAFMAGVWLLSKTIFHPEGNVPGFFIFMGCTLILAGAFFFIDLQATLLTIDTDCICLRRTLRSRTLLLPDIAGYRIGQKSSIYIVPKEGSSTTMRLSANFERDNELRKWLSDHFADLDEEERKAGIKDILGNEAFGATGSERQRNFARARYISFVGGAAAIAVTICAVIKPAYYAALFFVLFLLPLAGIFIAARFKGLIRIGAYKNSPYPSVLMLILAPILGTFIRMMADYRLYDFSHLWRVVAIGAVLLTVACFVFCARAIAREESKVLAAIVIAVMSAAYVFGLVTFINCHYDYHPPREFAPLVTDKYKSVGKSTSYYLYLEPWGPFTEGKKVTVDRGMYDAIQEGQRVHTFLYEGRWHIPWYDVTK